MPAAKIITTLRQRRAIEEKISRLLGAMSEDEVNALLADIVTQGDAVIPVILAHLDTSDPHWRGALGMVAANLPRESISSVLRVVAADTSLSDQARLTAVMILERFLEEQVEDNVLAGLNDPQSVATQSLQEAISEARRDRGILLEYVRALHQQPPEIIHLVLQSLENIPSADQVELARVLAQDELPVVRDKALALLGQNRTPEAYRALQILEATVPAKVRPAVERLMRKLRFAGVAPEPLPPLSTSWRVLVSLVDGMGNQSVWFMHQIASDTYRFLSVLLNDEKGLTEAFGGDEIFHPNFPPPQPVGSIHRVQLGDNSYQLSLLEADFPYGLRLVRKGLDITFALNLPTPLEYRLYNDILWGYSHESFMTPAFQVDLSPDDLPALTRASSDLLDLHEFATWFVQAPIVSHYAARLTGQFRSPRLAIIPLEWIVEIAEHYFEPSIVERYSSRLRTMAEWLLFSGQVEPARMAFAASLTLHDTPPAQHPFLLRLVQHGLIVALNRLVRGETTADTTMA